MPESEQASRSRRGSLTGSIQLTGGLVGGMIAYVLGYGVIALSKSDAIESASGLFGILNQFGGQIDYPAGWKIAGWAFYRAHNVDVLIDMSAFDSPNLVVLTESVFWETWFFAVPVIALLLAGAVVAAAVSARSATSGLLAGGSVVVGYGFAVAAGALLTVGSVSIEGSVPGLPGAGSLEATVRPELFPALLVAGIVYPLVVGGIGGAIAGAIRGR